MRNICSPGQEIADFLTARAEGSYIPWSVQCEASQQFNLTLPQVEEAILTLSLLPLRYKRNVSTFNHNDQLTFFRSKVTVIGCGGLGGYIIEELARLGIGNISAIDNDGFEESNLNRQINSSIKSLGKSKSVEAAERVLNINPAVTCLPKVIRFSQANGAELIEGSSVVVDALDSIPSRRELAQVCRYMNVPLVHGAIAGWYGQVAVQYPEDNTINKLYSGCDSHQGIETNLGNPSFTPAVIASIQVAEVCKILLKKDSTLRGRVFLIDLCELDCRTVEL